MVVDTDPTIAAARPDSRRLDDGRSPERFASVEDAIAQARASNARYVDALLRERVTHGLRRLPDAATPGSTMRHPRRPCENGRWRGGPRRLAAVGVGHVPHVHRARRRVRRAVPEIAKQMIDARRRARLWTIAAPVTPCRGSAGRSFLEVAPHVPRRLMRTVGVLAVGLVLVWVIAHVSTWAGQGRDRDGAGVTCG